MIVKMSKYTFVVLASRREEFFAGLQELGLVDVTTSAWEPSADDLALISAIDTHREAIEYIQEITPSSPFATGAEAIEKYTEARREIANIDTEAQRLERIAKELEPLGEFDLAKVLELLEHGVDLELDFVPTESPATVRAKLKNLVTERQDWEKVLQRVAATRENIASDSEKLTSILQLNRARTGGETKADGSLVVIEGWARQSQEDQVDTILQKNPDVIFLKAKPTPDDETPVELHNRKISRPFEFISMMYALPRYGTMDLTRWFAPFYMLFFAFCLSDAGYGALIFAGGLFFALKGKDSMREIGKLSMWCGGAAVVFGFLASSFFGMDIKSWPIFAGTKNIFFPSDDMFLFAVALGLGVFQILFGMVLKVITTIRAFGFKYALATIGWILVIVSGLAMVLAVKIPPIALWIVMGVGGFMMLFLNNPGKNPLVNLGGGLWNTYNDVTGFLSDALSYIRLFAIGLSGGVLAKVFNDLAFGLSPDIPVVGQIVTLLILLIGHGLNLFMSALSSMVHPLRLTFVEFYKNAGFEATTREFNPLKK